MITTVKIALLVILALIAFQDIKDKKVNWVFFPISAIMLFILYQSHSSLQFSFPFLCMNIILITSILGIVFVYTKYIRGMKFLNVSFGLGDVLFFYAFALGFPTITFLVLFTCSIMFSLVISLFNSKDYNITGVPLAGLMSLFLAIILSIDLLPSTPSLYIL
ncbi:hypothetical protein SAMN04488009_2837 [Maribacter sedimenticola]|uniref:Type IV leader peptidase family protein n=1 Tax=Maribacter sedimenticola TaxID=228956 RepID=A0ABY1SJ68_9FLAO|nr:hypothetical protein SAMN04488009_2837 [Maribacter sedimenticola]